jgi:hypothetical protein
MAASPLVPISMDILSKLLPAIVDEDHVGYLNTPES